jgi:glutathione S-transferase
LGDKISLLEVAVCSMLDWQWRTMKQKQGFDLFAEAAVPALEAAYRAASLRPAFQKTA